MGKIRVKPLWLLFLACIASFVMLGNGQSISAEQTVNRMNIDVVLNDQGTATITENWSVTADEGSEIYKVVKLVGPQALSNYQVSMDGRPFNRQLNWQTDDNRKQKAYKFGQHGNELNWGITKYGTHQYTIRYQISNFVEQTATKQMIAWQFLNSDVAISPKHLKVTLHDPNHQFSVKNGYGVWGFGFAGKTAFDKGQVTMQSTKDLSEDNYVKMIVQIPRHTYGTLYTTSRSFDSYMKEAFKGSDYNYQDYKNGETVKNDQGRRLAIIVVTIVILSVLGGGIWVTLWYRNYRRYYPTIRTLQKQTKGEYYREVPTGSIYNVYLLFSAMLSNVAINNFLSVGLLQLIRDQYLTIQTKDGEKKPNKKKITFVLSDKALAEDTPEPIQKLHQLLQNAATDGVVTQKAFGQYLSKHSKKLETLTKAFRDYSQQYGEANDLFFSEDSKRVKTGDRKRDRANRAASWLQGFQKKPAATAVDLDLARLKNYLQEFTLLDERTPQEVGLWDDLMLAAAAFGIAEEVAEQLTIAYPGYEAESAYYYGSLYPFFAVQHFSSGAMSTATSTGSGGGTSFSGGGSFGGGSGGGGFR